MFIAPLFIIAKKLKQPKCPSTDEWTNKMWYIQTMGYYSAIRKNEVLTYATTWMDLENIIRNERSQSQEIIYYIIPFI